MDQFEFFFTFYGLLLGLAAAELLGGLGGYVRARPLRTLDPLAGLLAVLVFLVICATWLDAWSARDSFDLTLGSLWAPIGAATSYYLVATVVLPRDEAQFDQLELYLTERRGFIVATMVVAELFVMVSSLPVFAAILAERPAGFWLWSVPHHTLIFACWFWLWRARSRHGSIAATAFLIAIYSLPYWVSGSMTAIVARAWAAG